MHYNRQQNSGRPFPQGSVDVQNIADKTGIQYDKIFISIDAEFWVGKKTLLEDSPKIARSQDIRKKPVKKINVEGAD
ncbi:hypothetical protein B9Z55_027388 [Caenorhabditis nigoni]|uniref:Uncharacterized protein n=1 Tax=Caenorhabditis nigoni TaxID=1611254 RepID=A0A2G5SGT8_9PELO|nr:hypothetical protein B9Z55_027388 [Caenorhabditis nigoni]